MPLGPRIDALAHRLLELRTISGSHWALRAAGVAGSLLALLLTIGPHGDPAHLATVLLGLAVALALVMQLRTPDSDLGLLAPGAIVLFLSVQADLTLLRAAGVGAALLIAHSAFALAATVPAHGVLTRSAWRLAGRGLLPVAAMSVLAGLLVALLAGVQLGPWTMVLGVLAVIALFAVVLPRAR